MKNHYEVLGVQKNATLDQIKTRYRFLVKAFHPDRYANDPASRQLAEEELKKINEAHSVLSDPLKRNKYDQLLATSSPPQQKSTANSDSTSHNDVDEDLNFTPIVKYVGSLYSKWFFLTNNLEGKFYYLAIFKQGLYKLVESFVQQTSSDNYSIMRDEIFVKSFEECLRISISMSVCVGLEKKHQGLPHDFEESKIQMVTFWPVVKEVDELLLKRSNRRKSIFSPDCKVYLEKLTNSLTLLSSFCGNHIPDKLIEEVSTTSNATSSRNEHVYGNNGPKSEGGGSYKINSGQSYPASNLSNKGSNNVGFNYGTLLLIIVLSICVFGVFSLNAKPKVYNDKPTATLFSVIQATLPPKKTQPSGFILPTNTKIRPTSTPNCKLWSSISIADKGKNLCVYGTVIDAYFAGTTFHIRFGKNDNDFRLLVLNNYYYDGIIGKCVQMKGKVKTYNSLPYIEVGDELYRCE